MIITVDCDTIFYLGLSSLRGFFCGLHVLSGFRHFAGEFFDSRCCGGSKYVLANS